MNDDRPRRRALTPIDLYLLLAGTYISFAPWTPVWTNHPLVLWHPALFGSPAFRGFLTGIGLLHFYYLHR